jgi:predicted O-methyltransferase YrrM
VQLRYASQSKPHVFFLLEAFMLKTLIKKLPPISALIAERDALKAERNIAETWVPAGHFYSPIVAIDEARRDEGRIFCSPAPVVPGLDLNEADQIKLLEHFEEMYPSIDFPRVSKATHRYFFENDAYSYSDAIMLHCMMRHFKPEKIIEVGSGYSSCAMLDTNERHFDHKIDMTFIEPYPDLLRSLLRPSDLETVCIMQTRLQDVPLDNFKALQSGDFLFIDSTHVSKTGSDVNYLFFEILPALNSGVHIHIHDVFYPFEYPKDWVMAGRSWNEIYILRAFLQFNESFKITIMNTYLEHFHEDRFKSRMPLCLKNRGGSIWLKKK